MFIDLSKRGGNSGGGSSTGMTEDQQYVIAQALNDLNTRIEEINAGGE